MAPGDLKSLFWDTNFESFHPEDHPDYTIFRVLELGDDEAVEWLRRTFSESEIRRVLSTERRLSAKSANFWALFFHMPSSEVAALNGGR
jgi:uncharacterized protein DUF6922